MAQFNIPEKAYTTNDDGVSQNEKDSFLQGLGAAKDDEVVHLNKVESITLTKTFKQAPKSEVAASSAEQLVRFQEFNPVKQQVTTNVDAIAINTAKVGITTTQANNIETNNAKVGITTEQTNQIIQNANDITPLKRDTRYIGQGNNTNFSIESDVHALYPNLVITPNSLWAEIVIHDNIAIITLQFSLNSGSTSGIQNMIFDITGYGTINPVYAHIPLCGYIDDGNELSRNVNARFDKLTSTNGRIYLQTNIALKDNSDDHLITITGSFQISTT